MSDFPVLRSGAITQYPFQSAIECRTRVLRFVDGSEQRFRVSGAPAHQWAVHLDLLTEDEAAKIDEFFELQRGRNGDFRFVDPNDGKEYLHCSLDHDEWRMEQASEGRGNSVLVVKENPA